MRIIPTKIHGLFDYLMGVLLIGSPWIFDFADRTQMWVPVVLGSAGIIYSLLTDYEFGMTAVLPMRVHLVLDTCSGIFLAASPWIFVFYKSVYIPHLSLGLVIIAAALITERTPSVPVRHSREAKRDH